jgi:hypothetical protein
MINRGFSRFGTGPVIDMTPDGAFVTPTRTAPSLGTILSRLVCFGVLLGVAAVTFWAALFIIPTLILLGLAGYAVTRLLGGPPSRGLRRF